MTPVFSIRRGLMIGLAKEGFEENFLSLTDTIYSVVTKHGPLSIADIQYHISETRDLFNANVSSVLEYSSEVVRVSRLEYDTIDRVFGPIDVRVKLVEALKLCLVDGPCSVHVLSSRLAALGYAHERVAILSFLKTFDSIEVSKSLVLLVEVDDRMAIYNRAFTDKFDPGVPMEANRSKIKSLAENLGATSLFEQDYRLAVAPKEWIAESDTDEETNSIISEMMEEFDF